MSWEAAGALGEIIGAVAVIATLAFLAVQIRQGSQVQREANVLARSAAIDRVHDQLREFACFVAADPELTRIWLAGCAGEPLDTIDQDRFDRLAAARFTIFTGWEQRAVAVSMPGSAELAVTQLVDELRRNPGLRARWDGFRPSLLGRMTRAVTAELSRQPGAALLPGTIHDPEQPAV